MPDAGGAAPIQRRSARLDPGAVLDPLARMYGQGLGEWALRRAADRAGGGITTADLAGGARLAVEGARRQALQGTDRAERAFHAPALRQHECAASVLVAAHAGARSGGEDTAAIVLTMGRAGSAARAGAAQELFAAEPAGVIPRTANFDPPAAHRPHAGVGPPVRRRVLVEAQAPVARRCRDRQEQHHHPVRRPHSRFPDTISRRRSACARSASWPCG